MSIASIYKAGGICAFLYVILALGIPFFMYISNIELSYMSKGSDILELIIAKGHSWWIVMQTLVLGSPTKFGTMSMKTRLFLRKLKSKEWANKPFAAFDTENPENIERKEGSAAEKISEKLKEKKMNQLLPVLKAVVFGMKVPLQEGEIERPKTLQKKL